ncbi:mitochondrial ribosomal protein MRP51 [Plectosphaerella cucumerina]|uniref:Mitochondrial ribosomal protein MRP51 n=1 Tax=Plectosphaerella cucumerina TaxID=40658 RepID=A0A8K0X067_9PEZI|nr:mitochondrial ribosomal protein MRP51 [Plectosphaerella cucumerina]
MAARVSPGGALLRTSRLFSLPKAIPHAPADSLNNKDPNIGTSTHPTHQAIATYPTNKALGDWGLKRSLPLKATNKTSAVRVKFIDSPEMVTDYNSATEHTVTVQKFHELGLPLTVPALPTSFGNATAQSVSVFETDTDFTYNPADGTADSSKRWKFTGPWLAGMSEGEFNQYLRKTVRQKRPAFKAFLKERFAADANAAARQEALEKATDAPAALTADDISEEQYDDNIRKLRADRVTLFTYVSEFLDLAPMSPPSARSSVSAGAGSRIQARSPNPYAERGPPTMHPSGGLSYLRTAAHVDNHPIYGPQAEPTPVITRIITPKATMNTPPRIGVAGFVADPPAGDSLWNSRNHRGGGAAKPKIPGLAWFDPSIPGGPKTYTSPRSATVNSAGKIVLRVEHAGDVAQLIAKELVGEADVYTKGLEALPAGRAPPTFKYRYQSRNAAPTATDATTSTEASSGQERTGSKTYGL